MSYLVLARKYRPQTFEQVIGQEHVTRTLQNAIRRGRIHHAFLFCGGRGTGKTTTARILAKALSCQHAPTPDPCNQCPACIEITQGTSVDVQEIDAASQNRVEDIRDLREAIRYAPVRGKKKLYILDEVHMLSTSAFNALLKTLEEPPPHAVFVFATTDPHKLPQTILSRVQRYDFKLVPTSRLVEHLADVLTRENIEFERNALYLIAREGAGSVRDSLSLLDQVLASVQGRLTEEQAAAVLGVADRSLILSLGRAVVERNAAQVLAIVDNAYQRGFDLAQLARTFLSHLRDLVVVEVVPEPLPLLDVTSTEMEELQNQARQAAGRAEMLFDRMVRVTDETTRAPLARYVLEVGLVELCRVEPLQPLGELVERLEQLEERLAGKAGRPPGRSGGAPTGGEGVHRLPPPASGLPSGGRGGGPAHTSGETSGGDVPVPSHSAKQSEPPPTARFSRGFSEGDVPTPPHSAKQSELPHRYAMGAPPPPTARFSRGLIAGGATLHAVPVARNGTAAAELVHQVVPPLEVAEHLAPVERLSFAPLATGAARPSGSDDGAGAPDPGSAVLSDVTPAIVQSTSAVCPPTNGQSKNGRARDFPHLIKTVLEHAPPLGGLLARARPMTWDDSHLVLGLPTQFDLEQAQQRLHQMQSLFGAALGHPVQVEFIIDSQADVEAAARESLVEAEARARRAEHDRRRREASDHPARKLVSDIFGEVSFQEPEVDDHG